LFFGIDIDKKADVRPPTPHRVARLFIVPSLLTHKKKNEPVMMLPSRDLSLLGWALRYERDTGEVNCKGFFLCVCAS